MYLHSADSPHRARLHRLIRAIQHGRGSSDRIQLRLDRCCKRLLSPDGTLPVEAKCLRSAARLLETADYLGHSSGELRALCQHDANTFDSLPRTPPAGWPDQLDSHLRYSLACIQTSDYREQNYDAAFSRFSRCLRLLKEGRKRSIPALAIRGRAHYLLGHTLRKIGDPVRGRHHFAESLRVYRLWADASPGSDLLLNIVTVLNLIGLAAIEIREGAISGALALMPLAIERLPKRHELLSAIVQLTYGTALLQNAGTKEEESLMRQKAIRRLGLAHQSFAKLGHTRFLVRTSLELANAAVTARSRTDALAYLREMHDGAEQIGDEWWKCESLLCQSRIDRRLSDGRGPEAEQAASSAYERATKANLDVCRVNALIEKGRIRLDSSREELASRDFRLAYEGARSQGQKAVAGLLLTRALLRLGKTDEARRFLDICGTLIEPFELPTIRSLAENVRAEYDNTSGKRVVIVDPESVGLNYEHYEKQLRKTMVALALQRSGGGRAKAAEALGITRTTLNSWAKHRTDSEPELPRRESGFIPTGDGEE